MEQEPGRVLTRDEDGWYNIFSGQPLKEDGDWVKGDNTLYICEGFTGREFHAIFGCHPIRKGRKRKIKRILIELED